MEVSGLLHAPAALSPGNDPPAVHWLGGWVDPRADLDAVVRRKIPSPRGESNSRTELTTNSKRNVCKVKFLCLTKHQAMKTYGGVDV